MAASGTHDKRVLRDVQQRVELACPVQRDQIVTATDVAAIDEDLRHRGAPAGPARRLAALSRTMRCIDLAERHALAVQQADSVRAVRTPGLGIDFDVWHS